MILAAGLGTRLRPLTELLPKPLVPIGDRPAIVHVAGRLHAAGVERVVVNLHHRPEAFEGVAFPCPVELVHEETLLGTAGGLANVRDRFRDDALVWNGDILADPDLGALRRAMHGRPAAAWLVAPRPAGEGTVGVDARGDVCRVRAFGRAGEVRGGDFLGVQIVARGVLDHLPRQGCLVGDVLVPALRRGARVATVTHDGPWDDIGSLPSYLTANLRWLGARTSHVGHAARVEALLDRAIVGAGARVTGDGVLREVVVFPGAAAVAPLERAVVTNRGVVLVPSPRPPSSSR